MRGIYKITNIINNKVYIGETMDIKRRWDEHIESLNNSKHHSYKLQADWNKYGEEIFKLEVIREIDMNMSMVFAKTLSLAYESRYIKQYDSIKNGYNIEDTLEEIFSGRKTEFVKIGILKNVAKNIEENNGDYIPKKEKIEYCIFQIKCLSNDKYYINKSKNIDTILNDSKKKLLKKRFGNKKLQNDFNMYGVDNFEFSILYVGKSEYELRKISKELAKELNDKSYGQYLLSFL